MNILIPVDVEDEVRLALKDYMTVYVRPLPEDFTTPCILIKNAGGTTGNTIDSSIISMESRAESDEAANAYLRTAIGILEEQAKNQVGALRHVAFQTPGSWGTDPVRPDLKLATATAVVTTHREAKTITES